MLFEVCGNSYYFWWKVSMIPVFFALFDLLGPSILVLILVVGGLVNLSLVVSYVSLGPFLSLDVQDSDLGSGSLFRGGMRWPWSHLDLCVQVGHLYSSFISVRSRMFLAIGRCEKIVAHAFISRVFVLMGSGTSMRAMFIQWMYHNVLGIRTTNSRVLVIFIRSASR